MTDSNELIKDPVKYDPEQASIRVLMDDWRIACAWYSTMMDGKKIEHSKETIINLAKLIYQELLSRGIKFHPGTMTTHAKDLYRIVSGKVTPDELTNREELRHFSDFKIVKHAISMVGSTVNSRFDDYKDIDLLIRMREPEDSYIRRAIEVRVLKMMPPHLRKQIDFIWGDPEGSHDEYIPLYDLTLTRVTPEIVEMHELAGTFKPMKPFQPLKTTEKTYFAVDDLIKGIYGGDAKEHRWAVEKKYDGFRTVIHRSGDRIKIFSDQSKDITSAFPTAVSQAKRLTTKDFIIDCEMVPYDKEGRPQGRSEAAKFIGSVKSGKKVDDTDIIFHVFDILYLDGRSLGDDPWYERKKLLNTLDFTKNIKQVYSIIVEKSDKMAQTVRTMAKLPRSEGAMLKRHDSIYPTTGRSNAWVKYKTLSTIKARVMKVNKAGEHAVNYTVGLDVPASQQHGLAPSHLHIFGSRQTLLLGNTFNTQLKAKVGDVLEILVEEVWRHETKGGIRYSIHKPRVQGVQGLSKTSTIEDLDKLVVSKGVSVVHSDDTDGIEELSGNDDAKVEKYKKWKKLVNMSAKEIKRFYDSDEGKKAGLSKDEAGKQGISSGRQSAEWLMKMIPLGGSIEEALEKWTDTMWKWAGKQISFISRMSGAKGPLYETDKKTKTRKLLSLLIWGHDPRKENQELQGKEGSPAPGEGRSKDTLKNFSKRMQRHFKHVMNNNLTPNFVHQWHFRGKSVHSDVRHKIPGSDILEGFTLNTPPNTTKPDEFNDSANGILTEVKTPQPEGWLNFEGFSKPGSVGATKYKEAWFIIIAKGKYKVHAVEDHRIVIEYFTDEGSVNQKIIGEVKKRGLPIRSPMPDKLKQLHGKFLYQIAHLPAGHVVLTKHLKEDGT